MADREKVIKGMTELKKYLPSTMWEPINNALALLKEQEAVKPTWQQGKAYCGSCGKRIPLKIGARFCHKCGKAVQWNEID